VSLPTSKKRKKKAARDTVPSPRRGRKKLTPQALHVERSKSGDTHRRDNQKKTNINTIAKLAVRANKKGRYAKPKERGEKDRASATVPALTPAHQKKKKVASGKKPKR